VQTLLDSNQWITILPNGCVRYAKLEASELFTSISPDVDFRSAAAMAASSVHRALSRLNLNITSSVTPFNAFLSRTQKHFEHFHSPITILSVFIIYFHSHAMSPCPLTPAYFQKLWKILTSMNVYQDKFSKMLMARSSTSPRIIQMHTI